MVKDEKIYPEVPQRISSKDKQSAKLLMLTALVGLVVLVLSSMHLEFQVDADGSKRLTIDIAREQQSAPPPTEQPEVKGVAQLVEKARIKNATREYEKAIDYCNEALSLEPTRMDAYIERGLAYFNLHRFEKAFADADRAINGIERNDENLKLLSIAYNNRGCAQLEMKKYEEALADFDEATKCDPQFYRPYLNRSLIYKKMSESEQLKGLELRVFYGW